MQHFFECLYVIGLSQVTTIIYPCIFNKEPQQDNKSVTWLSDRHISFSGLDFWAERNEALLYLIVLHFYIRKTIKQIIKLYKQQSYLSKYIWVECTFHHRHILWDTYVFLHFHNGLLTGLFTLPLSCLFLGKRVALKASRGHVWSWSCLPKSLPKPQRACQEKLCCLGVTPQSLCLSFHCLIYRWTCAFWFATVHFIWTWLRFSIPHDLVTAWRLKKNKQ